MTVPSPRDSKRPRRPLAHGGGDAALTVLIVLSFWVAIVAALALQVTPG